MHAIVFEDWKTFPALQGRKIPIPRSEEVLLKVAGADACHSDVAIFQDYDADFNPAGLTPGFVFGHENSHLVAGNVAGRAVVIPNAQS